MVQIINPDIWQAIIAPRTDDDGKKHYFAAHELIKGRKKVDGIFKDIHVPYRPFMNMLREM